MSEDTDPFEALDESVGDGAEESEQPEHDLFEELEEEDVAATESDVLWDDLSSGTDATVPERVEEADRDAHIVSKEAFCQNCEHFADPPAMHCTHEGTDIESLTEYDRVVVLDCPIADDRVERPRN